MSAETKGPPKRSYDQYCAVARGLDVLGDRWTVLMVRELLLGPKRYKDLLDGLPGIGTNLLAARLRELEGLDIVRRGVLPPPAGSAVYELTESGQELEPVLHAIGRWGHRFLGKPRSTDTLVPSAYFVAMRGVFHADLAGGLTETYELRIADRVFEVRVQDGACTTRDGPANDPDVVMTMDVETLNALVFQQISPSEAISGGGVELKGDRKALDRFVKLFAFRPPVVRTRQVGG
jgi:DNA-binding HxlR family transcriptional regulator/putative sterol carrier protein